jgi:hypothetical protein
MNPQNCFVVQIFFLRAEKYVDNDSSHVECYALSDCKFTEVSMETLQGQAFVEEELFLNLYLQMSAHVRTLFLLHSKAF